MKNKYLCYNKTMKFLDKDISKIAENISIDRLTSYKYDKNDSIELILNRYIYNVQISESFYSVIAALEVALRNRLYNAIAALKGENWLLEEIKQQNILSENERNILLEAYNKLKRKNDTPSTGAVVAELTFGFWVNLCKKSYKNSLWDKQYFFSNVFPDFDSYFNSPTWDKTKVIFPELKEILRLRNRIFHHEIIINNKNGIENCYDKTHRVLYSLSKEYAEIFENSFRFKDIIKQKP